MKKNLRLEEWARSEASLRHAILQSYRTEPKPIENQSHLRLSPDDTCLNRIDRYG